MNFVPMIPTLTGPVEARPDARFDVPRCAVLAMF